MIAVTHRVLLASLTLVASLSLARAEDAPAPKPEPGTTAQSACIKQDTGWTREGRRIDFTITLTNACGQRITCRVFAYVTSAKGAARGAGRLTLPPGSKGQETKKSWRMTVKMAGGSAQTARECRAL